MVEAYTKHKHYVGQVPLDKMVVIPKAQRRFQQRYADRIVKHFKLGRVGVLHVSRRDDGTYALLDGQHRRVALEELGYEEWECVVYTDLTLAEEADIFVGLNTTAAVTPHDKFHASVTAEDPIAMEVLDTVQRAGWDVPRYPLHEERQINAVSALLDIYEKAQKDNEEDPNAGRFALAKILRIVTDAWGFTERASVNATMLKGMHKFLQRYDGDERFDLVSLIARLASYPGGATRFLATARGLAGNSTETASGAVAWHLTEIYNARRTSRRLPNWRG